MVLVVSAALPILVFLVPSILRRLWEGPTKPDTLHTQHRRNQELTFPGLSILLFTQKYRGRLSWLSRVLRKFFLLKSDRRAPFQLLPRDLSNALSSFCVSFYLKRSQQAIKDACPHFDGGVLKSGKTILTIAMGLHFTIFKY